MMAKVLSWLLPMIVGWILGSLANLFAGSCPSDPASWLCQHWGAIAGVGGGILAKLGYGPGVSRIATIRRGLTTPPRERVIVRDDAPGAVYPPPESVAVEGVEVLENPTPGRDPDSDPSKSGG